MGTDYRLLEEDILRLYREPIVGANYNNTYGEENLVNLVTKYRSLSPEEMKFMQALAHKGKIIQGRFVARKAD